MKKLTRLSFAASAATGVLLLSGCVVAPAPYYTTAGYPAAGYATSGYATASPAYPAYPAYTTGYADAAVYAPTAPPAPYVEVQPALPFVGAIWIGGFWNWNGGRYSWVGGHYERPRPGYHWEPRRWTAGSGGRWQLGGGWRR